MSHCSWLCFRQKSNWPIWVRFHQLDIVFSIASKMIDGKWNKKKHFFISIRISSSTHYYTSCLLLYANDFIQLARSWCAYRFPFVRCLCHKLHYHFDIHTWISADRKEDRIKCREHTKSISHFIWNVYSAQNFHAELLRCVAVRWQWMKRFTHSCLT